MSTHLRIARTMPKALLSPSYRDAVLSDSPAAWWRLGDVTSTVVPDSSGNNRTATGPASGWVYSQPGLLSSTTDKSLKSNGAIATILDAAWMDGWTAMTLEAWVNRQGGSESSFFTRGSGGRWNGWSLEVTSGIHFMFVSGGTAQLNITSPSNNYDTTGTHHIVMTYDGLAVQLYADGVLQMNTPYTGGIPASTDRINIGGINTGFAHYIIAYLQEFAIYDHALSSARVSAHTNAGLGLAA